MANFRALTSQSGTVTQIQDANTTIVGAGVTTAAGDLSISAAGGNATVQPGTVLDTTGAGNINLPNNGAAKFQVEAVSVGATVTAPNLDTLTNASNADALHVHATGVTGVTFTATSGEAIDAGEILAMDDVAGSPRVFKADANGASEIQNPVGVAVNTVAGAGLSVTVRVAGQQNIPDAQFDVVPGTADVGKRLYLSETAGNWTLTAPLTSGSFVIRTGIVSVGGAGAVKVVWQPGEGIVLA